MGSHARNTFWVMEGVAHSADDLLVAGVQVRGDHARILSDGRPGRHLLDEHDEHLVLL